MILSLRLQNFRSYLDRSFKFDVGANIIVGPNAIGKTNIIEAILVSRVGNSYRTKDINLIAFNKPWARIDSQDDSTRIVKIRSDQNPTKTFEINERIYKRLPSSLKLPVVLFEPDHLQLLNGSPIGRRAYLDNFLEQIDDRYGSVLRKYSRALVQRNTLLKKMTRPSNNQLFAWNIRLSQLAGQIVKARDSLVREINQNLPSVYSKLSGDKVKTSLLYIPQLEAKDYESHYLKKLESNLDEDLRAGFTLYGPHRDDLAFMFGKHQSNTYASRGELRTAVLALKVTELETIRTKTESEPIVLLDDVYSELDYSRRKALTSYLKDNQTFITTTDADTVIGNFANKHRVIKL